MKKIKFIFAFLFILNEILISQIGCGNNLLDQVDQGELKNDQVYTYLRKVKFRRNNEEGEKMDYLYLPVPSTNEYQEILNYYPHGGEIFEDDSTREKYIRYDIRNDMTTESGEWFEFLFEFDYIPKSSEYVTHVVGEIHPYDTTSEIYKMYTTDYFEYIQTDNPLIKQASDELWATSTDVYDYAQKCLAYVDRHFSYIVSTEFYSLDYIINQGGGDCGNLATVFINLLRSKKIPSRYVMTFGHVWAEFYLEGYGWIPVDPTFNLFGKAPSGYSDGIMWSNNIVYKLKGYNTEFYVRGLAQIHLTIPYPHHGYECDEERNKTLFTNIIEESKIPQNFKLNQNYPNPFNPATIINYQLQTPTHVSLSIYNLAGQEIAKLAHGFQAAGEYQQLWQAGDLPSGTYLCRLQAGNFSDTRKLVLQR